VGLETDRVSVVVARTHPTQYPEDTSVCSLAWFPCVTTMPSLRWSRLSLRWRMSTLLVEGQNSIRAEVGVPRNGECVFVSIMRVLKAFVCHT
jgi:hypothetical protein